MDANVDADPDTTADTNDAGTKSNSVREQGVGIADTGTANSETKSNSSYPCTQCGRSFCNQGNLTRHKRSHEGLRYSCMDCGKSFSARHSLLTHGLVHSGGKPHACDTCHAAFRQLCHLKRHRKSCHSEKPEKDLAQFRTIYTPACSVTGSSESCLLIEKQDNAIDAATPKINRPSHRNSRMKAVKDIAPASQDLRCCRCQVTFSCHGNLEKHECVTSANRDSLTCSLCEEVFHTREKFTKHCQGHRRWSCDLCGKRFRQGTSLRRHMNWHDGRRFSCSVCDRSYTSNHALQSHKLVHTGDRPFVCDVCGVRFSQLGHLNRHKLSHTGKKTVMCEICGKWFTHRDGLKLHQKQHFRVDPHECNLCGQRFSQMSNLRSHSRRHRVGKDFQCSECQRFFTTKRSLLRHCSHHQDPDASSRAAYSKPRWSCEVCYTGFMTEHGYKEHSCRLKRDSTNKLSIGSLSQNAVCSKSSETSCNSCSLSQTETRDRSLGAHVSAANCMFSSELYGNSSPVLSAVPENTGRDTIERVGVSVVGNHSETSLSQKYTDMIPTCKGEATGQVTAVKLSRHPSADNINICPADEKGKGSGDSDLDLDQDSLYEDSKCQSDSALVTPDSNDNQTGSKPTPVMVKDLIYRKVPDQNNDLQINKFKDSSAKCANDQLHYEGQTVKYRVEEVRQRKRSALRADGCVGETVQGSRKGVMIGEPVKGYIENKRREHKDGEPVISSKRRESCRGTVEETGRDDTANRTADIVTGAGCGRNILAGSKTADGVKTWERSRAADENSHTETDQGCSTQTVSFQTVFERERNLPDRNNAVVLKTPDDDMEIMVNCRRQVIKECDTGNDALTSSGNTEKAAEALKPAETENGAQDRDTSEADEDSVHDSETDAQSVHEREADVQSVHEREADVQTVHEREADIPSVNEREADVQSVQESETDIKSVHESEADIQSVHESEADVQSVDESETDIKSVLESEADIQSVQESETDLKSVHESEADVQSVHEREADVQSVDESETDVQSVQESETDIKSVHESEADIQSVHESEADVQSVDESETDIKSVLESEADIQSVQESETDLKSVHESEADVQSVHEREADVQSVDESETDVQSVPESEADIQSVHEREEDIQSVHEREADILSVQGSEADIQSVHGSQADVQSVHESEADIAVQSGHGNEADTCIHSVHESEDDGNSSSPTKTDGSCTLTKERVFCTTCQVPFSSRSSLKRHNMRRHQETGTGRGKSQSLSSHGKHGRLQSSKRNHYGDGKKTPEFVCLECNMIFLNGSNLKRHQKRWHSKEVIACPKCQKVFSGRKLFQIHLRQHKALEDRTCMVCDQVFNNRSNYLRHRKVQHNSQDGSLQRLYKCSTCGKSYTALTSLQIHNRQHSGEVPYLCQFCGKGFGQSSHLNRHIKTHRNPGQTCRHHGKVCLDWTGLRHYGKHHSAQGYSCGQCAAVFKTRYGRTRHIKRKHSESDSTGHDTRQFNCDVCGKAFETNGMLKEHKHIHTGKRPHVCHHCGQAFGRVGHLNRHKKRHDGERTHTCDVCRKSFFELSNLRVHMRSHTGEKPFKCQLCDKTFSQRPNLVAHLKTHDGRKEFECTVCGGQFTAKHSLMTHMKRHSTSGNPPVPLEMLKVCMYKCDRCSKGFSTRSRYISHQCHQLCTGLQGQLESQEKCVEALTPHSPGRTVKKQPLPNLLHSGSSVISPVVNTPLHAETDTDQKQSPLTTANVNFSQAVVRNAQNILPVHDVAPVLTATVPPPIPTVPPLIPVASCREFLSTETQLAAVRTNVKLAMPETMATESLTFATAKDTAARRDEVTHNQGRALQQPTASASVNQSRKPVYSWMYSM